MFEPGPTQQRPLGFFMLLLAACTSTHRQPSSPPATTARPTAATGTSPAVLGQPGCRPSSPINRGAGFPEVEGSSDQIQMWGLIMADGPDNPLRVNEQVKIVWRITGLGGLHLVTLDPQGRGHPLQWGPVSHASSSYTVPATSGVLATCSPNQGAGPFAQFVEAHPRASG
jgi:hypothetical protein